MRDFENLKKSESLPFEIRKEMDSEYQRKRYQIDKFPLQNEIIMDNEWWFIVLKKQTYTMKYALIVIWLFLLNFYYCILGNDWTETSSYILKEKTN